MASGPVSCRPWPHLPFGTPPCRVGQVGEGVSPALDVEAIIALSATVMPAIKT